jgi:uncharacterized protein YerC
MKMEPKKITFAELRGSKDLKLEEVWVMNRTAHMKKSSGIIALNVRVEGEDHGVSVPDTWIPWCLTDFVGADVLAASVNFRRAVNEGIITLHDSEECRTFMEDADAIEELNRLKNRFVKEEQLIQTNMALQSPSKFSSEAEVETGSTVDLAAQRLETADQAATAGAPEAIGVLVMIVQVMDDPSMPDTQKSNYLRTNVQKFKKVDFNYIIKKSTNNSIQNWARNELASRVAAGQNTGKKQKA